jgi:hypothetical protein
MFGTIETVLNLLSLLFSNLLMLSTLLNTLDCAGSHALSSHFTGAIVNKALEASSALRDHLILVGAQRDSMWNTVGFFVKYIRDTILNIYPPLPTYPYYFVPGCPSSLARSVAI